MKRKLFCLFLVFLFTLGIFGCDPRGSLSEKETQDVLEEIKADFSDDSIWDRETTVIHRNGPDELTIAFVKQAMEVLNDDSAIQSVYGMWWDSKRNCKIINIDCTHSVQQNDITYLIDTLDIAKYRDGHYLITVDYRIQSAGKSHYVQIEINS